ncbi:MAG TPA: Ig-like domain-containing protein [Candidatus Angelobacter sp.]|nr:Ig-like domain-containing protein [Candidatus Angelobacter sp.]
MRWSVAGSLLALLAAAMLMAGCGGSSSNSNTVAVVNLAPATISLVAGQVTPLSVSAVNSAATAVATTFTFNSTNPNLVTVSPAGLVCGGVWDSTFVTCNGNNASGVPLTGTATVTASAAGVTSSPVTVSVHPSVTSIQISPATVSGCVSHGNTQQFTAKALHNGNDITSSIGQFSWASSNGAVVSVDANGLATANTPGEAGIVASVGGVTSQSVPFDTCMPQRIVLHLTGDPPGQPTEATTLAVGQTQTIQADMIDTNGVVTLGAPISVSSNNPAVATIAGATTGATLTATAPGGAGLVAVCAPPKCGSGINTPVYSNLFGVNVTGTSPATTVYVGTTTIPAPGTSPAIIPIDTSKSPPAPGTPIVLPGAPTSMAFTSDGLKLYVDTSSGLVSVDALSNAATLLDADAIGTILAVSPDGTKVIISNVKFQLDIHSQRIFIFDSTNNTLQTFILPGAVGAAFTSDGFKAYIAANFVDPAAATNPQARIYVWSPVLTLRTLTPTGTPNSVAPVSAGPLSVVADGSGLQVFNVCDNSLSTTLSTTSAPQLVAAQKDANTIAVVNQTGVDIKFANLPDTTIGQCPPPVTFNNQFSGFGLGAFTARQVLFGSNGSHIAVLPVGIDQIGVAIPSAGPGVIPIAAGGTEAVSGDLTQDGNTLWAGVGGTNTVHEISLAGGGDFFQVQLNLNNTNAVPDLIAVRPK